MPTGPWTDAMRRGDFAVVLQANCRGVPNPLLDVQPYLPGSVFTANYGNYEDQEAGRALRQDAARDRFAKQRALMREFEKHVIDTEAHEIWMSCGGIASCRTAPMSRAGRSARAISSTRTWRQSGSTSRAEPSEGIIADRSAPAAGRRPRRSALYCDRRRGGGIEQRCRTGKAGTAGTLRMAGTYFRPGFETQCTATSSAGSCWSSRPCSGPRRWCSS